MSATATTPRRTDSETERFDDSDRGPELYESAEWGRKWAEAMEGE